MSPFVPPPDLRRILDAIRERGGRPLLAGGAVRDAAAGLEPQDFDVEVYGLGAEPLREALASLGRVNLVGKSFGVMKVTAGALDVDVSLPRRESKSGRGHRGFLVEVDPSLTPQEAAARRDFTINALLWDPEAERLLDFFGGREDLERRVLRHVGPAFGDDPLRVLRGMQFAGRFALRADPDTVRLSRELFAEADTLAVERVWGEWHKWAARSTRPSHGLTFLADCGWRDAHPELTALEGCPQDPEWHPEGDVWTHTLHVVDAAARIAERDGLDEPSRATLVLAALCHDLGKPETTVSDGGRWRSPGHAERDETCRRFLERIGCPRSTVERVVALGRQHLAHIGFAGSARHVRRLARALGEHGEGIASLARLVEADHSGRPPLPGGLPEPMAAMLVLAREIEATERAPEPLLRGRDLLALGVEAGPRMGRLLRAAYEAQLDGAFATPEEARAWIVPRLAAADAPERDA